MNAVEYYLREYWFARRSIGRMMMDLSAAQAALAQYCERSANARADAMCPEEASGPAAHAARIIIGQHRAEVRTIEARLAQERATLSRIEQALTDAGLSEREREYVRLRYFENRSAEAVCQRLFVSPATGGRIREAALKKLAPLAG